jgi:hypothetical protein
VNFEVTQCRLFKAKIFLGGWEMKKKGLIVLLIGIVVAPLMLSGVAEARQAFFNSIMREAVYPQLEGTKFETFRCLWCHVEDSAGPRNSYGLDYEAEYLASDVITAAINIEQIDSDGDGYTNIEEINAATWPGFADDTPSGSNCTDNDLDGYAVEGDMCGPVDCNDNDPNSFPGAIEVCGDGIDNNCDGYSDGTDPAVSPDMCCDDVDNDGATGTDQLHCTQFSPLDCNDNDPAISPFAIEACGDGIDNNCDSLTDEQDPACTSPCTDADIDGFYFEGIVCGSEADCNDNDYNINPLASEICDDSEDNNCDGFVDCQDSSCVNDSACIICTDNDDDSYAIEGNSCGPEDCNDNDLSVSPGAVENCSDLIDNDCDDLVDCADADCNGDDACAPACIPEASQEKGKKCKDGIDNDCDAVIDSDDPDCGGDDTSTGGTEGKGGTCGDGIDNDGDSLTDCDDPDCGRNKSCK